MRVEITCFEEKLFRKRLFRRGKGRAALVYCTDSEDALSPPFPAEGKSGISILAGTVASLQEPRVRMLWELERRRGRPSIVIVTRLKGKNFLSTVRDVETALGSSGVCPVGFLRRRGKVWDVLDFYSGGESDAFREAKLRLRRLKQAGWEMLVDKAVLVDEKLRQSYFHSLDTERSQVRESISESFYQLKLSPMFGIAGECLNAEQWDSLLDCDVVSPFLEGGATVPRQEREESEWRLLGKRGLGRELLLLGSISSEVRPGQIFRSQSSEKSQPGEFAIARIRDSSSDEKLGTQAVRVEVDWRYPPDREIATRWVGDVGSENI